MLLETLTKTTGISEFKLLSLSETASSRYKVYHIPKRSGGIRKIEHPSRELKAIQRWLVQTIFEVLPVHESATAYRKGSGIRLNAEQHRKSSYTDRFDFANFFPSFQQNNVEAFVRARTDNLGLELSDKDIRFIGNMVCRNRRLTIGAPSSPHITNTMMYDFDRILFEQCAQKSLIYTRYADDIFVSSNLPNTLGSVQTVILAVKKELPFLNLRLNHQKTAHLSRKHTRRVAGVVITPEHGLSIGRARKKEIKALVHNWINGKLPKNKISYLRGIIAFSKDIEPAFETRLRQKYGDNALDEILGPPTSINPEFYTNDEQLE